MSIAIYLLSCLEIDDQSETTLMSGPDTIIEAFEALELHIKSLDVISCSLYQSFGFYFVVANVTSPLKY